MAFNQSINWFRARRGRLLRNHVDRLAQELKRDITVLDIGGRADYWQNVGLDHIAKIDLINISEDEFSSVPDGMDGRVFENFVGDARDLSQYPDQSVDLVHSNSVIEHVGCWQDMSRMANEALRVGKTGWVQPPAWEFPIEPHFHLPFIHWLGQPLRVRALSLSPLAVYRKCDLQARRSVVDNVNMLTRNEFRKLFPDVRIYTERVLFAKSFVAIWPQHA